jgi:hypothetical protein
MKACGIDLLNENSLMIGLIKCCVYCELLSEVNLHKVDQQVTLHKIDL